MHGPGRVPDPVCAQLHDSGLWPRCGAFIWDPAGYDQRGAQHAERGTLHIFVAGFSCRQSLSVLCSVWTDGEEEGDGFGQHSIAGFIRRAPSSEVSQLLSVVKQHAVVHQKTLSFPPKVTADVHHGELLLRAHLSGCPVSQRPLHPPAGQTEAQAGAQLRTGEGFESSKMGF